jgi:hypothetical protein
MRHQKEKENCTSLLIFLRSEDSEHLQRLILDSPVQMFSVNVEVVEIEEQKTRPTTCTRYKQSIRNGWAKNGSEILECNLAEYLQKILATDVAAVAYSEKLDPLFINLLLSTIDSWTAKNNRINGLCFPLAAICSMESAAQGRGPLPIASQQHKAKQAIQTVLRGAGPVMIEGAIGAGKTELTKYLHDKQGRDPKRFGIINPARISGDHGSSLFYGTMKGSFTGVDASESIFEAHDGGTILFDDFQDFSPENQVHLLGLLDHCTNCISGRRIGKDPIQWKANVQVYVAVNRPVLELIATNKLRMDVNSRIPRTIKLESLSSTLSKIEKPVDKKSYLRRHILGMQARALGQERPAAMRGFSLDWVFEHLPIDSTSGRYKIENFEEAAPIPDGLVSLAWHASFRDLEFLARQLLAEKQFGQWGRAFVEDFISSYKCRYPMAAALSNTLNEPNGKLCSIAPARLNAYFYLNSIMNANSLSEAARSLDIDGRTLKKKLLSWVRSNPFTAHLTGTEVSAMNEKIVSLLGGKEVALASAPRRKAA